MRTTLTLDDDVTKQLERLQKARSESFKAIVNEVMRAGLIALQTQKDAAPAAKPYETPSFSVGKARLASLDDIAEVLALGEGEDFR